MENNLKVSIIIPAYNIDQYIEKCVISCLNQTYKNLEIIIINDGSTDDTLRRIEALQNKDKRIILINKSNEGLPYARRDGINISTGDYIFNLDGDDYLPEDAISNCIKINNITQYDIIIGNYYQKIISKNSVKKVRNLRLFFPTPNYVAASMIIGSVSWSYCIKLIKRDFITNCNLNIPIYNYAEDGIVLLQLLSKNPKIKFINDFIYFYVNRKNSISFNSSNLTYEKIKSFKQIRNIIRRFKYQKILLFYFDLKFFSENYSILKKIYSIKKKKSILCKIKLFLIKLLSISNYKTKKLHNFTFIYIPSFILLIFNLSKFLRKIIIKYFN